MIRTARALFVVSALLLPGVSLADCDVATGKKQFNKCSACHSIEADLHLVGPSLHGLMGRKVGTAAGFAFSEAMEAADFEWSAQTLSLFLEDPMGTVPGNVMPFGGIRKAEQREAIVCYIEQSGH